VTESSNDDRDRHAAESGQPAPPTTEPAAIPVRAGGRRIAIERWLASNGLPACVHGHSSPAAVLRRPLQLLATALVVCGGLVTLSLLADLGFEKSPIFVTAAVLACLAASYLLVAVGVPDLAIFTITWFVRALWRTGSGLAHVLPLLLVAVTFFFLTGETWMSIGRLTGIPFLLAFVLVLGLAIAALARRESSGLSDRRVEPQASWFRQAVPATLLPEGPVRYFDPPLNYAERLNLRLVSILGRALVAIVVGLVVATFFLVFGVIVVDASVAETFAGAPPRIWWEITLANHTYVLTAEHFRVSAFLGAFAGLYFIVSSSADSDLAAALSGDTRIHLRRALAVRAVYRAQLDPEHAVAAAD
jgi:hypothetical protein